MAGCCTLCDREVFDVLSHFMEPDPRAGQPKALGEPFECARRVTYQLDNGSIMEITFCDSCDVKQFEKIMAICTAATIAASKVGSPVQAYIVERYILGILYNLSWREIIAEEVRRAAELRMLA